MTIDKSRSAVEAVKYYDERASSLFERYRSVSFEQVHGELLPYLPSKGARCLDVGSGSGRDSAYMSNHGCEVTAVEPSGQLRQMASRAYADLPIRWVDDALPPLTEILQEGFCLYDFILVSAVWMHIPPRQREESLSILRRLVKDDGVVIITIRNAPHLGEPRIFFDDPPGELMRLATVCGFRISTLPASSHDVYGREDISWVKYLLRPVKAGTS